MTNEQIAAERDDLIQRLRQEFLAAEHWRVKYDTLITRLSALRSRYAGDASLTGREVLGVLREVEGEKQ